MSALMLRIEAVFSIRFGSCLSPTLRCRFLSLAVRGIREQVALPTRVKNMKPMGPSFERRSHQSPWSYSRRVPELFPPRILLLNRPQADENLEATSLHMMVVQQTSPVEQSLGENVNMTKSLSDISSECSGGDVRRSIIIHT